jgi:hypothetical protein
MVSRRGTRRDFESDVIEAPPAGRRIVGQGRLE